MQPKIHHSAPPGYVPRPVPPRSPFDTSQPRLCEIREVLKKARSALSARSKWASIQSVQELPTSDKDLVEAHAGCVEEPIHSS